MADVLPFPEGEELSREIRRSRRKRAIRAKTISIKRMSKRELRLGRELYPEDGSEWDAHAGVEKPRTRGDCAEGMRPCPFVSCAHHLYLDVSDQTGSIKLNFPDIEPWQLEQSCALDVADRGGITLEQTADVMNVTRERIRQIEVRGLARAASTKGVQLLREYVDEGPVGKRRLPVLVETDGDFGGQEP